MSKNEKQRGQQASGSPATRPGRKAASPKKTRTKSTARDRPPKGENPVEKPAGGAKVPPALAKALAEGGPFTGADGTVVEIDLQMMKMIPQHTPEELKRLEADLLREGAARNPLVKWKGHDQLLDGH